MNGWLKHWIDCWRVSSETNIDKKSQINKIAKLFDYLLDWMSNSRSDSTKRKSQTIVWKLMTLES